MAPLITRGCLDIQRSWQKVVLFVVSWNKGWCLLSTPISGPWLLPELRLWSIWSYACSLSRVYVWVGGGVLKVFWFPLTSKNHAQTMVCGYTLILLSNRFLSKFLKLIDGMASLIWRSVLKADVLTFRKQAPVVLLLVGLWFLLFFFFLFNLQVCKYGWSTELLKSFEIKLRHQRWWQTTNFNHHFFGGISK